MARSPNVKLSMRIDVHWNHALFGQAVRTDRVQKREGRDVSVSLG